MIISKSKIKADWKLTVLDTDGTPIALYQFPDNFLNPFFEAFNGFACQPLDDWGDSFIKWGYSSAPIDLNSDLLGNIATLPSRFTTDRWQPIKFGDPGVVVEQGKDPYYASGYFDYDPVTKICVKRSGNYNDPSLNSFGNPRDGRFIILESTDLTAPLTEIGAAYNYEYNTYWHLDDANNPVYTDPRYMNRDRLSLKASPYVSTRALVLDKDGNPTSITLAPGQKLKIERSTTMEFQVPDPLVYTVPILEGSEGATPVQTGTRQVTVRMIDPARADSFVKNAPIGSLTSVWWPQQMTCYTSGGEVVPGWGQNQEWITAGWDPVQLNWGNMAAHDFDVSNRYDGDKLDFTTVANRNIAKVVIHDGGAVDAAPGYTWNLLAEYEFNPPIETPPGMNYMSLRFGYRMKRHISALEKSKQSDYSWWADSVHIVRTFKQGNDFNTASLAAYDIGTKTMEPALPDIYTLDDYTLPAKKLRYNPNERTLAIPKYQSGNYGIEFRSIDDWSVVRFIATPGEIEDFEYNHDYSLLAISHERGAGYAVYQSSDWTPVANMPTILGDWYFGTESVRFDQTKIHSLVVGLSDTATTRGFMCIVTDPNNAAQLPVGASWEFRIPAQHVIDAVPIPNSQYIALAHAYSASTPFIRMINVNTQTESFVTRPVIPSVIAANLLHIDVLPDGSKLLVSLRAAVGYYLCVYDVQLESWTEIISTPYTVFNGSENARIFRVSPDGKYIAYPDNLMISTETWQVINHPKITDLTGMDDSDGQVEIISRSEWANLP